MQLQAELEMLVERLRASLRFIQRVTQADRTGIRFQALHARSGAASNPHQNEYEQYDECA